MNIERLLRTRVPTDQVPMALQPYTPCRNFLPTNQSNGGTESNTPAALRAALAVTTPVELGAKPKGHASLNGGGRPSLDFRRRGIYYTFLCFSTIKLIFLFLKR